MVCMWEVARKGRRWHASWLSKRQRRSRFWKNFVSCLCWAIKHCGASHWKRYRPTTQLNDAARKSVPTFPFSMLDRASTRSLYALCEQIHCLRPPSGHSSRHLWLTARRQSHHLADLSVATATTSRFTRTCIYQAKHLVSIYWGPRCALLAPRESRLLTWFRLKCKVSSGWNEVSQWGKGFWSENNCTHSASRICV